MDIIDREFFEFERFVDNLDLMTYDQDPLHFWVEKESEFKLLSPIALDILSVPATSAPVERSFSTAGDVLGLRRLRLADNNFEAEVMYRMNKHLLHE